MQLITYADRLADDLRGLRARLDGEFGGLFSGVHILPFFDPIDGADAGFDPVDHTAVDARLGDWNDIAAIAADYSVMADLIVNHKSSDSAQFVDVMRNGTRSKYWNLFLKREDVYPSAGSEADFERIFRPRPGKPFTTITLDDGNSFEFWTTFSAKQLDIDVESAEGRAYLDSILEKFASAGIREIRLDAVGYAIKRAGTSCFMLPETFDFISQLSRKAASLGVETLVEIHAHHETQIAIAAHVGRVYDFALPPLVLHTLYTANTDALKRWLGMAPRNCVTVLDTHDGIGIMDVARDGDRPGLLADDQVDELVTTIHERTRGASRRASGYAASNLDIYQVNTTYYDALGRDDRDYLVARAIQFFAPGDPQVYYVGLLAGHNDTELVETTGVGRDINRHRYTREEIGTRLENPVVDSLLQLIRLRNDLPAFDGEFSLPDCASHELRMRWETLAAFAELRVSLRERTAEIEWRDGSDGGCVRIADTLQETA